MKSGTKNVDQKNTALLYDTLFSVASVSLAQTGVPDAIESDPNTMGWMKGFPPSDDRVIGHPASDYFSFPRLRWTFCHFREIQATRRVTRGRGPVSPLPESLDSAIDGLTFTPIGGDQTMTWQESLDANYTDGILVLHRGQIVYEYYSGCLDAGGRHGAMSVTKSFVGTVAEILIADGVLDDNKRVIEYVLELGQSAFGGATVRQVMDMTAALITTRTMLTQNRISGSTPPQVTTPKPASYTGPTNFYEFLEASSRRALMVRPSFTSRLTPMHWPG